jgi:hypothetical protein
MGLLAPAFGASLWATIWLTLRAQGSGGIRLACVSLGALISSLLGYFILQTLRCDRLHRALELEGARSLRRDLRPSRGVVAVSVVIVGILIWAPGLFRETPVESARPPGSLRSRPQISRLSPPSNPPRPLSPDSPTPGGRSPVDPKDVLDPALPTPSPTRPAEPEIRPILALEPQPIEGTGLDSNPPPRPAEPEIRPILALDPQPFEWSQRDLLFTAWPEPPPSVPQENPFVQQDRDSDVRQPKFRTSAEDFREATLERERRSGILLRAAPEEMDWEAWLSPEIRLDGLVLFGHDYGRAPALTLACDLPFSASDSIEAGWLAVDLPRPDDSRVDHRDLPDWNHLTLNYTRRLVGYTRHALFDLAVSVGASVDFIGAIKGLPVVDRDPKFAPYVAIDTAIWQEGALGLLLHAGQAVPVTIGGSSVGVTDVAALLRLDVSDRFSVHAGYRFLTLRFKESPSLLPVDAPNQTLVMNLSGPVIGIDLRF